MQFHFEPHPHSQPSEGQAAIQQQFNAHTCKVEGAGGDPKEAE
jgi:hypothetical protein